NATGGHESRHNTGARSRSARRVEETKGVETSRCDVRTPQRGVPYHMKKLLTRIVDVKPNELRALWLGFAFHFLILSGYYITKPIRDSIGASSSMEALPWMFTATLVTMLIANAAFAATVARMSRRKFIPLAYGFFIVVFTLFFI